MNNKQSTKAEIVIKEYPNSTYRRLDGKVIGIGNLILTSRRFIFLHRVNPTEQQLEALNQLIEKGNTEKLVDYSIGLERNNFQIKLSDTTLVKMGLLTLFPFPRPCFRIIYRRSGQGSEKMECFTFTIPFLKGIFQLELTTVMAWIWTVRKTMRHQGLID